MVINGFSALKSSLGMPRTFSRKNRQTIDKWAVSCNAKEHTHTQRKRDRKWFYFCKFPLPKLFPSFYSRAPKKSQKIISYVKVLHYILWMNNVCHLSRANYVVMYVWRMDEFSTVASIRQQKVMLNSKNKRKTFSFSSVKSKTFHFVAGWVFFIGACKENNERERWKENNKQKPQLLHTHTHNSFGFINLWSATLAMLQECWYFGVNKRAYLNVTLMWNLRSAWRHSLSLSLSSSFTTAHALRICPFKANVEKFLTSLMV